MIVYVLRARTEALCLKVFFTVKGTVFHVISFIACISNVCKKKFEDG